MALLGGSCLYFAIPSSLVAGMRGYDMLSPAQTLGSIDYFGVITLVSI